MLLFLNKSFYNKMLMQDMLLKIKMEPPKQEQFVFIPEESFRPSPVFSKIQIDGCGINPCCEFPNFVNYKW